MRASQAVTRAIAAAALLRPQAPLVKFARASRVALLCASSSADERNALHRRLTALAAEASSLPPSQLHAQLAELTQSAAALQWLALDAAAVDALRVDDLRSALAARGLPSTGLKAELRARLLAAIGEDGGGGGAAAASSSASAADTAAPAAPAAAASPANSIRADAPPNAALSAHLAALARRHAGVGPQSGVFCDGGCAPNPGPGGWGVVAVSDAIVQWHAHGRAEGDTTNNRMELSALIAALERLPADSTATLYSDSNLCVRTLNEWAAGWEANGWRRSRGQPVENADLVRHAYSLFRSRPRVQLRWLKGHGGATWNEYADALASAWSRGR